MTSTLTTQPTSLYRLFDAEGSLLYVGITFLLPRRIQQHSAVQMWWNAVARIEVEHFADRLAAGAAEIRAINTESPQYNIKDLKVPISRRDVRSDRLARDAHAADPTTTAPRRRGQPPKPPEQRRQGVHIRLPAGFLADVRRAAVDDGMTLTEAVEQALTAWLSSRGGKR